MSVQQNNLRSSLNRKITMIGVIITLIVGINAFLISKIVDIENQYTAIKQEVENSRKANENVLAMLVTIRNEQQRQAEAMQIVHMKKIQQQNTIMNLKQTGFSIYTDLGSNAEGLTVEDMDKIIAYYNATAFEGHGEAFIKASEATGLSPIYIFAHAATESGYGTSYLARTKHNYFGIAAYDSDPDAAYAMGNSVDEGIINGALWIKKHYYDDGDVTLEQMNKTYASNPKWANDIATIANKAIEVL